jgi:peroxiredoxin
MLKVGTQAPDIASELEDGTPFQLAAYAGKKLVVLYFYLKDFTKG